MGYSPWGHKESDMTKQLHTVALTSKFPVLQNPIPKCNPQFPASPENSGDLDMRQLPFGNTWLPPLAIAHSLNPPQNPPTAFIED